MQKEFQKLESFDIADRVLSVRGRNFFIFENDYFIYMLRDPRNQDIKYIGQTCNLKRRYEKHLQDKQENCFEKSKSRWIFELRELNSRPQLEIIETLKAPIARELINERESRWIFHVYQQGADLTNGDCVRLPNLFKAIRKSKINFLIEPLDSTIWKKLLKLQILDQKKWVEINYTGRD